MEETSTPGPDVATPLDPPAPPDLPDLAGMPGLLGVDHVGVAVPDLDAAVAFHTRVLGLRVTHREVNEDQQVEEAMLAAPGAPTGAVQVQLLAPTAPTSAIARFLARSGPGLQQLAYRVRDVEAAATWLEARGVRLLFDAPRRGTAGSLVTFAHPKDCGGVLVELVQPAGPVTRPASSD